MKQEMDNTFMALYLHFEVLYDCLQSVEKGKEQEMGGKNMEQKREERKTFTT
jgi:hypothetical protein